MNGLNLDWMDGLGMGGGMHYRGSKDDEGRDDTQMNRWMDEGRMVPRLVAAEASQLHPGKTG